MRRFLTLILVLSISGWICAQSVVSPAITNAMTRGDANAVSAFFNENVELVVGSVNDVFSNKQASSILADFFRRNRVASFQVIHRGSKDNSAFAIATMRAGNNNYRVYILVRIVNNQQLIQQLRIESSNEE